MAGVILWVPCPLPAPAPSQVCYLFWQVRLVKTSPHTPKLDKFWASYGKKQYCIWHYMHYFDHIQYCFDHNFFISCPFGGSEGLFSYMQVGESQPIPAPHLHLHLHLPIPLTRKGYPYPCYSLSMAMKTPILILNIQNNHHEMTVLKPLK